MPKQLKAKEGNFQALLYNAWSPVPMLTTQVLGLNYKFTHLSYLLTPPITPGLIFSVNIVSGYLAISPSNYSSYAYFDLAGVFTPYRPGEPGDKISIILASWRTSIVTTYTYKVTTRYPNNTLLAAFITNELNQDARFNKDYIANSLGAEVVIQPLTYDPVTPAYSVLTNSTTGTISAAVVTPPPGPPGPPLGSLTTYAAVGGSTITSTGFTVLNGDLGLSPGSAVVGFPPGIVTGTQHVDDPAAVTAKNDLTIAYTYLAGLPGAVLEPADIGGLTLGPGVYTVPSTLGITGTVTLDGGGDPNSTWVFQVPTAMTTAVSSVVALINGANADNIYWQIGSSATLGVTSTFNGSIFAQASITANTGAVVNGRLLARTGAVSLDGNPVTVPTPPPPPPPVTSAVFFAGVGGGVLPPQPPSDQTDQGIEPSATAIPTDALFPIDIILPTFTVLNGGLAGSVFANANFDAIWPINSSLSFTVSSGPVDIGSFAGVTLYGVPVDNHRFLPATLPRGFQIDSEIL